MFIYPILSKFVTPSLVFHFHPWSNCLLFCIGDTKFNHAVLPNKNNDQKIKIPEMFIYPILSKFVTPSVVSHFHPWVVHHPACVCCALCVLHLCACECCQFQSQGEFVPKIIIAHTYNRGMRGKDNCKRLAIASTTPSGAGKRQVCSHVREDAAFWSLRVRTVHMLRTTRTNAQGTKSQNVGGGLVK